VIRVAVADDQAVVRAGFAALIDNADDLTVVGQAADGGEAVVVARAARPHVFVMDVRMPGTDGIDATRRILGDPRCDGVRVLMLTTFELDEYVFEALRAGASGFVTKSIDPDDLRAAIRTVAGGDALLAPSVTRRVIDAFAEFGPTRRDEARFAELTDREREVWRCVAAGASNAEIAEQLYISQMTAKTHVSRLLDKLQVRSRAQLVVAAYESGFVTRG
jgi:DNA-binding NarL/FixJ family response regulator